jgi:cytidylate kinase
VAVLEDSGDRDMDRKRKGIIAIDGPSGAGKSTVARVLAAKLGYIYVDTGAMYRVVALRAKEASISFDNEEQLVRLCRSIRIEFQRDEKGTRVYCNGQNVTDRIRVPSMSLLASEVSRMGVVREAMVRLQRALGEKGGIVIEGRDIGTVVFPGADLKFFLDADPQVRGRRRYEELKSQGNSVNLEETIREIEQRDAQDSSRSLAPLKKAADAILIDTTYLSIDEVVQRMMMAWGEVCLPAGGRQRHRLRRSS